MWQPYKNLLDLKLKRLFLKLSLNLYDVDEKVLQSLMLLKSIYYNKNFCFNEQKYIFRTLHNE